MLSSYSLVNCSIVLLCGVSLIYYTLFDLCRLIDRAKLQIDNEILFESMETTLQFLDAV